MLSFKLLTIDIRSTPFDIVMYMSFLKFKVKWMLFRM